jgi:hypothetical protein
MSKNLINKLDTALNNGTLFEIVDNSLAVVQVMDKLGFSNKGQYIVITKQYLLDNDIDISHFTPNGRPLVPKISKKCLCCGKEFKTMPKKEKEQVVCSRACSNTYFRSGENHGNWLGGVNYRKLAFDAYGKICSVCEYDNEHALEVHHIDKNRDNNDISNLKVLCANCHTLTHKGKL